MPLDFDSFFSSKEKKETPSSSGGALDFDSFFSGKKKEEMTPPPTSLGSKVWEGAKSFGSGAFDYAGDIASAGMGILGMPARGLGMLADEIKGGLTGEEAETRVAKDSNVLTGHGIETPGLGEMSMQGLEDLSEEAVSQGLGIGEGAKLKGSTAQRAAERNKYLNAAGTLGKVGKLARAIGTTSLGAATDPSMGILGPLGAAAQGNKRAAQVYEGLNRAMQAGIGIDSIKGVKEYLAVAAEHGFDSPQADDVGANVLANLGMVAGLEAHGHQTRRAVEEMKRGSWDQEITPKSELEEDFSKATNLTDLGEYLIGDEMQPPPPAHLDIEHVRGWLGEEKARTQDRELYAKHRAIAEAQLREQSRRVMDAEAEIAQMKEERAKRKQQEIEDAHQMAGIMPQDRLGTRDWKPNDAMRVDTPPDLSMKGTEGPLLDDTSHNEPHPLQEPDPLGHLVEDVVKDAPPPPQQPPAQQPQQAPPQEAPPQEAMQPPPTQQQAPPASTPEAPPQPPVGGEMQPPPSLRSPREAQLIAQVEATLDKEGLKKGSPERAQRAKKLVLEMTNRKRVGGRGQRIVDAAKAEMDTPRPTENESIRTKESQQEEAVRTAIQDKGGVVTSDSPEAVEKMWQEERQRREGSRRKEYYADPIQGDSERTAQGEIVHKERQLTDPEVEHGWKMLHSEAGRKVHDLLTEVGTKLGSKLQSLTFGRQREKAAMPRGIGVGDSASAAENRMTLGYLQDAESGRYTIDPSAIAAAAIHIGQAKHPSNYASYTGRDRVVQNFAVRLAKVMIHEATHGLTESLHGEKEAYGQSGLSRDQAFRVKNAQYLQELKKNGTFKQLVDDISSRVTEKDVRELAELYRQFDEKANLEHNPLAHIVNKGGKSGIESQLSRKEKQAAALRRVQEIRDKMAKEALPPTEFNPDMLKEPPKPGVKMPKEEIAARKARREALQLQVYEAQKKEVAKEWGERGSNPEMLSERTRNQQAKMEKLQRMDEDPFAVLSEADKRRKLTQKMLELKEKKAKGGLTPLEKPVTPKPETPKPRLAPKNPLKEGMTQKDVDHVEALKSRLMEVRNELTYMDKNPKEFSAKEKADKMQQLQQLEAEFKDSSRKIWGKETGAMQLDPKAIAEAAKAFNTTKFGQGVQGAQGVYQASLAGGLRTAVRNVIAAAGEGSVMNLADVVNAAQFKLRGRGERAGEHWAKVEQRFKNMKTTGLLRNMAEAAPALLGEGKASRWLDRKVGKIAGQKEHRAQLENLETAAKAYAPTELYERWRHLVGSEVQISKTETRPLKTSEKVGRFLMLANELQERAMRLGIMQTELAPYMKKHGVKDYKGLLEKAMKDDVAAVDIGNVISQAMTASLQRTKGLGPKGKMGKAWTDAFNATPGSKFVQPFTNFLFNNFIPNMMESNPLTANLVPKSNISRMKKHAGNVESLKGAIPKMKDAMREYAKFVKEVDAEAKAAPLGEKMAVHQRAKARMAQLRDAKNEAHQEVMRLKREVALEQEGGVYSESYRTSLAAMGPLVIGMSALLRAARGEDGLDATQLPTGKDEEGNTTTRQLGPILTAYAPYVVLGDMLAREAMGSKYYQGRFGKKLGEGFTGGQSGRPGLADIYSAYVESDEKGAEVVRKVMADIGQGASKMGWIGDVAQMFREASGGEQPYRRPDLTDATKEGALVGGAKALGRGVMTPWNPESQQVAYDPSSGKPRMAPTILDTILHGGMAQKRLSPLTTFLQSHPNVDVRGALMKQAGSVKWDEARFATLREKLEEDVIPIIEDDSIDDATKEDLVSARMRKIISFATDEAKRSLEPEDIPQKEVEKEQKAMEKEERRKQSPELFGRQPGYRGLRKGEQSQYRDSLADRMTPPPKAE